MSIFRLRAFISFGVLFLILILTAGCKEDSTTSPQTQPTSPTIVSFTAEPASVPVGGDSVKLSWKVNDATALSIAPNVGTVSPSDSGSMKVFVSSATTFTLTATNSSGNATATAQVSAVTTMTVSGYVKDIDGEPISGMTVVIKGKSPTSTGADGSFTIADVTSPYEVRTISGVQKTAIVYQGLTASNPTLLYLSSTTAGKQATISGAVPVSAEKTLVCFNSGSKGWYIIADPATGVFSFSVTWKGSISSLSGHLQVLRWSVNSNGLPVQYDAYGSKQLTISDGGIFTGNYFYETDFTDPAEMNINGSITKPTTSYNITSKQLNINFGGASIAICSEYGGSLTDNFSYIVPSISGTTFEIQVMASVSSFPTNRNTTYRKKAITGGSNSVTIDLVNAPQLNLPVNNGTEIDTSTQFLWTQGGGTGVNYIAIMPSDPGNPAYYIFTAGTSANIPNLAPQGLGLPAMANYSWMLQRIFPVSSIDEAASDSFIAMINGQSGDNGISYSEMFNFTTHQ